MLKAPKLKSVGNVLERVRLLWITHRLVEAGATNRQDSPLVLTGTSILLVLRTI